MTDAPTPSKGDSYEAPALFSHDAILFPDMEVTITVGDPRNVAAAAQAFKENKIVVLIPARVRKLPRDRSAP